MRARIIMRGLVSAAMAMLVVLPSVPGLAATGEELLDLVKIGCQARFDSVHSCKGSVLASLWLSRDSKELYFERKLTAAVDGDRLKISSEVIQGKGENYEAAFDGTKTTQWRKVDTTPAATIIQGLGGIADGDYLIYVDPKHHGMAPLGNVQNLKLVSRETLGGDECVVVEVNTPVVEKTDTGVYPICRAPR